MQIAIPFRSIQQALYKLIERERDVKRKKKKNKMNEIEIHENLEYGNKLINNKNVNSTFPTPKKSICFLFFYSNHQINFVTYHLGIPNTFPTQLISRWISSPGDVLGSSSRFVVFSCQSLASSDTCLLAREFNLERLVS